MRKKNNVSRIVIIDAQYKLTKDTITTATDKLTAPTGVVINAATEELSVQNILQILHKEGFVVAANSEQGNEKVLRKNPLEQVAYFTKYYDIVFLIYPHKDVDLCYQDAIDLSPDVITIH